MITFWEGRSPRERMLLMAAAVLVVLLVSNILIVSPLRKARAAAFADLSVSSRTLDVLSVTLPEERAGQSAGAPTVSGEALRSRLVDIAVQQGISVSRLQTGQNGETIIHFDNAAATLVFAWLNQAEGETGAKPQHVSMFSGPNGTVRASFEFEGAGSQ